MNKTRKLTTAALLCAIAYIAVFISSMLPPLGVEFLKYDPKDTIIVIGGFMFGPLTAFAISVVVSLIEMFTISSTSLIGFLMNVVSTCAFACVASSFYKKYRTLKGAVVGLILGCIAMTSSMIVWNYIITPIFMHSPRADVVKMLVPVFLPFNLIKGMLNTAFTLVLYKPFSNLLTKQRHGEITTVKEHTHTNIGVVIASLFIILMCILGVMIINK